MSTYVVDGGSLGFIIGFRFIGLNAHGLSLDQYAARGEKDAALRTGKESSGREAGICIPLRVGDQLQSELLLSRVCGCPSLPLPEVHFFAARLESASFHRRIAITFSYYSGKEEVTCEPRNQASRRMYGDGEPSDKPLEPEGADQASTSGSSGEALAKEAHDNPAFIGNARASTSGDQQQSPDAREGEAGANLAPEGPSSIPFQNDAGWVPLVLNPIMFPGNPESWNGTPGTIPTGAAPFDPFQSGAIPLGAFPPGITPPGTVDGTTIPQWMPVLIPVQMPLFLPSPPSDQAGQSAGFYPVPSMIPFYQPFGIAPGVPGAPAGLKFPVPMNVPTPTEGNLPAATAGQPVADAGRAPPVVAREGVPPAQVGQMQPNGAPLVAQAGVGHGADQRRIVRRFQVGIQLDLLLLLKLAVVVFVFNQDGSKDRLLLLLGLAGVIYLYQTGSLAPLLRWLAERAQHFMTPPQQLAQAQAQAGGRPPPEVQAREALVADAANPAAEEPAAEAAAEAPAEGANPLPLHPNAQLPQDPFWAFVKEVQMLVVGFVTSLLPGFHPHAD